MWLRLARRRITLPVPVSRNRFPAPLWVFIFGMVAVVSVSLSLTAVLTAVSQGRQQSPSPALAPSGGQRVVPRRQHCRRISPAWCCYRLGRTRYHGAVGDGLARRRLGHRRLGRRCRGTAARSGWCLGARAGDGLAVRLRSVCLGLVLLLVRADHHDHVPPVLLGLRLHEAELLNV